MNPDLEAVARAIHDDCFAGWKERWDLCLINRERDKFRRHARAVLLADPVRRAVMEHLEREVENLGTLDESIAEAKDLLARMRAQTKDGQ